VGKADFSTFLLLKFDSVRVSFHLSLSLNVAIHPPSSSSSSFISALPMAIWSQKCVYKTRSSTDQTAPSNQRVWNRDRGKERLEHREYEQGSCVIFKFSMCVVCEPVWVCAYVCWFLYFHFWIWGDQQGLKTDLWFVSNLYYLLALAKTNESQVAYKNKQTKKKTFFVSIHLNRALNIDSLSFVSTIFSILTAIL